MVSQMYSQSALSKNYKNVQVNTASRERLLLMVYDGILKSLKMGRIEFRSKNLNKAKLSVLTGQSGILELIAALDLEKGGEIAVSLNSLYIYSLERTSVFIMEDNIKALEEIIAIFESLRKAWGDALKKK